MYSRRCKLPARYRKRFRTKRFCSPPPAKYLLRCFLVRQDVARIGGACRIDRHAALINVLNDSILVDYERGAITIAPLFIEDAIVFHHGAFEIAEQRESDAILLGKLAIGRNAVDADAENLCVCSFEFGDISLIRLHLLRSTPGESQYIEGEHNVFLTFKVAELVGLSISGTQAEVWRGLANL